MPPQRPNLSPDNQPPWPLHPHPLLTLTPTHPRGSLGPVKVTRSDPAGEGSWAPSPASLGDLGCGDPPPTWQCGCPVPAGRPRLPKQNPCPSSHLGHGHQARPSSCTSQRRRPGASCSVPAPAWSQGRASLWPVPSSAHAQLCSNQKPGIRPVKSKAGPLWSGGQWARASCPTTAPGKDALTCHLTRLTSAVWGRGSQGQNTEEAAEVPPDRAPALCLRVRVQSGPHTGPSRGSWRETELLAQLPASTGAAPVGHSGQELTSTGRAR